MEIGVFERELRETGASGEAELADILGAMCKVRGSNFPLPETKRVALSTPELKLRYEWLRQAQKYLKLGFHKELRGLSEQEYLDSLPKFGPQPENFKGRFDIPVIVETRISVERQCELARIDSRLGALPRVDWTNNSKDYKTLNGPYIIWMQDGAKNLRKKVEIVREELAKDERGATIFDGIALYLAESRTLLRDHFIELPGIKIGTKVGSISVPCLSLWSCRPTLRYHTVGRAYPNYGAVTCGIS